MKVFAKNVVGITVTSDDKFRQFLARWLVCLLLVPGLCYPQALPSVMQKAVSGVMQNRLVARGFAANDPRWASTFTSAGSSIGGAAAAAAVVTLAGITAPAWVTVAATAALGTVFAAGISLAVDAAVKWAIGPDGKTAITRPAVPPAALVKGGAYWVTNNTPSVYAADAWSAIQAYYAKSSWAAIQSDNAVYKIVGPFTRPSDGLVYGNVVVYYNSGGDSVKDTISASYVSAAAPQDCPAGSAYSSGTKSCFVVPLQSQPAQQKTYQQAVDSLTAAELAQPVNPQLVAQIADAGWRTAAAQPGYQGVPYDAANPVTTADAAAWQQANPQSWPTVADAVKPAPAPSGGTARDPFAVPAPTTSPSTSPGDSGSTPPPETKIDWAMPVASETIPKVAAPVSFTPTLFASPQGCPVAIPFTLYGQQHAISYEPFCDLMKMVAPIFIALGALSAALIFASSLK